LRSRVTARGLGACLELFGEVAVFVGEQPAFDPGLGREPDDGERSGGAQRCALEKALRRGVNRGPFGIVPSCCGTPTVPPSSPPASGTHPLGADPSTVARERLRPAGRRRGRARPGRSAEAHAGRRLRYRPSVTQARERRTPSPARQGKPRQRAGLEPCCPLGARVLERSPSDAALVAGSVPCNRIGGLHDR
jgi:hypothetical protein